MLIKNRLIRMANTEKDINDFKYFCDKALVNLNSAMEKLVYAYSDIYGPANRGDEHWQNVTKLKEASNILRDVFNNATKEN